MTAADILDAADRLESPFPRHQARVSRIAYCERRHVAEAIGRIDPLPFPRFYAEMGHALERRAYDLIRQVHPLAIHQLEVDTTAGSKTHVDLFIPELELGVEVKTATDSWIRTATAPKTPALEQALCQWTMWTAAGGGRKKNGTWIGAVPRRYQILYVGRGNTETLAAPLVVRKSFEVKWDPDRARALRIKHERTKDCIDIGILPPKPYTRPQVECEDCPLWRECWI